jgi:hypothetical protein
MEERLYVLHFNGIGHTFVRNHVIVLFIQLYWLALDGLGTDGTGRANVITI